MILQPVRLYLPTMKKVCIIIAGAGELGKAIGLMLAQHSFIDAAYYVGDKYSEVAIAAAHWISDGNTKGEVIQPFQFDVHQPNDASSALFGATDIIIDCLPAPLTPKCARLARRYDSHYINLTATPCEVEQIQAIANGASKAFLLQAGVAPGLVNLLLKDLFQRYRTISNWPSVDYAGIRVAMLPPRGASAPPDLESSGPCAFLTCREAILISNLKNDRRPAISIWETTEINGRHIDTSIMAGGFGNLVSALSDRIRQANHSTHLGVSSTGSRQVSDLFQDWVLAQVIIEGYQQVGKPVSIISSCRIHSARVGERHLTAQRIGRAVLLAECAYMLLTTPSRGIIFMNQLEPQLILGGTLVHRYFITTPTPEIIYRRSTCDQ